MGVLAALPDWLKKWALKFAIGKFLDWLDDKLSGRAAREVENREQKQKDLDARPPDFISVDDRLGDGSA